MLAFTYPWLILLLPLPWLVNRFLPCVILQSDTALKIPFFKRLLHYATQHKRTYLRRRGRFLLLALIWGLLVLSATGPKWLGNPIALTRTGRNLLLAVDLSGSMAIPDMRLSNQPATRLATVKQVASAFIRARKGDRVGLILFGSKAYLQTPLTFDHQTVIRMLQDASIGLAGVQTAIGDAIGLAIKRLMHYPAGDRVLVLLTDGADNASSVTPVAAAKFAAENGITIYSIGMGADKLTIQGPFSEQTINPSEDLDMSTLKKISEITGGKAFRAKDTKALASIYAEINRLKPAAGNAAWLRDTTPLYPLPLAIALLLSLLLATRYLFQYERKRAKK